MPAANISRRTAGEGLGRTARMHIPEESDSGVVPMSHSNNDGQLSAESGEGRLLIKENVRQPDTLSTQSEIGVSHGLVGVRKAARESIPRFVFAVIHPR
jgi:RNA-directed DNA polymerase